MTGRQNRYHDHIAIRSKSRRYSSIIFTFCEFFFSYLEKIFLDNVPQVILNFDWQRVAFSNHPSGPPE